MPADPTSKTDQQHLRLLQGLAASIRANGLAGTQVGDIVRHAHASRRTFYKHFPDKDSCLVELVELSVRLVLDAVAAAIDPEAPLAVQIDQAIDAYTGLLASERELTLLLSSPALADRVVRAQRDGIEQFAQFVVSMIDPDTEREPAFTPLTVERAYMLVSGLRDAMIRAIERNDDLNHTAAEGKAVIKAALGVQPSTDLRT